VCGPGEVRLQMILTAMAPNLKRMVRLLTGMAFKGKAVAAQIEGGVRILAVRRRETANNDTETCSHMASV
jgi:hypothetical protein